MIYDKNSNLSDNTDVGDVQNKFAGVLENYAMF